jgi:hypothetical protein
MRRIFWGFCINWFLIDPLHYLSSRSDFETTRRVGESIFDYECLREFEAKIGTARNVV